MATKYILEQIKIDGILQELLTKSNGENVTVTYDGESMTLTAALAKILAGISALPSGGDVDAKISAAVSALIGGAPETYDTLKEIADYISTHEDVVTALNSAIGAKASQTDFNLLKATVDGLGALATKSQVTEADLDTALKAKVNAAAEGNHAHENKDVLDGLTAEKVAAWDGVRGVRYGAAAPADMKDGEMLVKVVTEE